MDYEQQLREKTHKEDHADPAHRTYLTLTMNKTPAETAQLTARLVASLIGRLCDAGLITDEALDAMLYKTVI